MFVDAFMHSMMLYEYVKHSYNKRTGCQTLILHDIAACFPDTPQVIWIPFYCDGELVAHLQQMGHTVIYDAERDQYLPDLFPHMPIDALYFGTPTIANNKILFPSSLRDNRHNLWNASYERMVVRSLVAHALSSGAKLIVSGLGSGDITPTERISDMGGGRIVCKKDFIDFFDYVIVRNI